MKQQSAKSVLDVIQNDLDKRVVSFLSDYDYPGSSTEAVEAFEFLGDYISRPSKRIRGSVCILTYHMFGGTNEEAILDAALAVELVQNYFLSVDDVMDRSELRRGKPTLHLLYKDKLAKLPQEEADHFSNMLAINVGLITSHIAGELMSELDVKKDALQAANKVFHRNVLKTAIGQTEDLYSSFTMPNRDKILSILNQKSSYYTFINPMHIGAILAGAGDQYPKIEAFGISAGLAFQLQDDLIGLFGDSKISGKPATGDLKEGKKTILIDYALDNCSKDERKTIEAALGDQNLADAQAEEVRTIVESTGSKQYSLDLIEEHTQKAREVLKNSNWQSPQVDALLFLLDKLEARNS